MVRFTNRVKGNNVLIARKTTDGAYVKSIQSRNG